MTTVAWDLRVLSVDSRSTIGPDIMSDKTQKLFRNQGVFSAVVLCGSYDIAKQYMEETLCTLEHPLDLLKEPASEEFSIVGILKGTQEAWRLNGDCTFLIDVPWAFGSGADYALAAMDHGKTAVEAVKYAATRDFKTNNRIQSYTVKPVETKETK